MATASDKVRRARPLLGPFVEIEAAGAARPELDAPIDAAFEAVARVHRLMSFHEPDSDVSRLNRETSLPPVKVHAWTFQVLQVAVEMHRQTKGIFDVAIAPALQTMGLLPRLEGDADLRAEAGLFGAIELFSENVVHSR